MSQQLLTSDSKFKFDCHKGLKCFTQCCYKVNIFLTPYDILRMKNRLGMSSTEFLQKYTHPLVAKNAGIPVVTLKMKNDQKNGCPFVTSNGCIIYEDRPWSCRSFPLDPVETEEAIPGNEFYRLIKRTFCQGFNEDKEWTVEEWKRDQGMDIYDEIESPFKEITTSKVLTEAQIVNEKIQQMFYMACYDIDRFKKFIFETKFLNIFDVEKEVIKEIKTNEIELLKFGFRWLKFGLLDQDVLKVKPEILKTKNKKSPSTLYSTGGQNRK